AADVVGEQPLTLLEALAVAARRGDLEDTLQRDDEPALRRRMEVHEGKLPGDAAAPERGRRDRDVRDLHLLEVRLARLVGEHAGDLHERSTQCWNTVL